MAKRILDLEKEVAFLKTRDMKARELLSKLGVTVELQQKEILHGLSEKLQGKDEFAQIKVNSNWSNTDIKGDGDEDTRVDEFPVGLDSRDGSLGKVIKKSLTTPRLPVISTIIAFYAYMSSTESSPGRHHTLIFHTAITNIGDGYNQHTGIFTAPSSGVYVFSYSITPENGANIPTEIVKNSDVIGSSSTYSYSSYRHTSASTVVVQLSEGDVCYIRTSSSVTPSGSIHSADDSRSSFAGWLIA